MSLISRSGTLLLIIVALSMPAHGQQHQSLAAGGGPFSDLVLNAPFSAKAVTMVREVLPDGTVREHTVTATYDRDSQGRVRAALDNPSGQYVVLWIPQADRPAHRVVYALDPDERTYRFGGGSLAKTLFNGEGRVAVPVGRACFRVGPRVVGESESERLQAVDAQLSPDLGIVIASHWSNNIMSVDYRLTRIRRNEPPAELFDVPTDYTFVRGSQRDPLVKLEPWNAKIFCAGPTR